MWLQRLFALIGFAAVSITAQAIERSFPPNAIRAVMSIASHPHVMINGKSRQLSAGARIRNTDNLIVMSSYLGNKNMLVNFTEDLNGNVQDVWILTSAEAKAPIQNIAK
ncbi:MAG: hypothetical protein V4805_07845 [Pseudomonadota bacterium]